MTARKRGAIINVASLGGFQPSAADIVYGATGGIGSEFCRALAAQGYHLIITGRRPDALAALQCELANSYPISVDTLAADLASPDDVQTLSHLISHTAGLEIFINNAGLVAPGPLPDVTSPRPCKHSLSHSIGWLGRQRKRHLS